MKIYSNILAICALAPVANAFMIQPPTRTVTQARGFQTEALKADNNYSYLGNLNEDAIPQSTATSQASTPAASSAPRQSTGASNLAKSVSSGKPITTKNAIESLPGTITVQGGALRTCSFEEQVDRVSVFLKTDGRPLNANVELWQGPDNTPQKMSIYLEDGSTRPFRATVESPGSSNAIAIRNTGQIEFPLKAGIEPDMSGEENNPAEILLNDTANRKTVQGGAVYTTPFPPSVQSVQVALRSDGRPMNARVELLQGPNNNKQVMDIYTEDGAARPFYVIIDTPGNGNVVRIVNTATVEFPLTAAIEPYVVDNVPEEETQGGMMWS